MNSLTLQVKRLQFCISIHSMKKIFLVISLLTVTIFSNAQYLGLSYKESMDIIFHDKGVKKYKIKNSGDKTVIILSLMDTSVLESSLTIQDDKCIEYRRVFKNYKLESYLITFKFEFQMIGEDKWQDKIFKNEFWSIIRHKNKFELVANKF
jgi:hypothetical protein